jgi:hypothetical protein
MRIIPDFFSAAAVEGCQVFHKALVQDIWKPTLAPSGEAYQVRCREGDWYNPGMPRLHRAGASPLLGVGHSAYSFTRPPCAIERVDM